MITIISGTNRSNSNTYKVASTCKEILDNRDCASQIFSLEDLPNDFLFSEMYQDHTEEFTNTIEQYLHQVDKIIFVIPEYHGSYPGVLKSFMDAISDDDVMNKKAMLIGVASGHAGAIRPLGHFTEVLHHLKVEVFSRKPKLSYIDKLLGPVGINNKNTKENLETQLMLFLAF